MRVELRQHRDTPCAAVSRISVLVSRPAPGMLALEYLLEGRIDALRLPPLDAPLRTDGLWRRTCFEAFARAPGDPGYHEFNLSPSTRWAAYRFDGYRAGMRDAEMPDPGIESGGEGERWRLAVRLDLRALPRLPGDALWLAGLSAVIEEADGAISYWALAHPPGKPDFHHSDCFALELSAREAA